MRFEIVKGGADMCLVFRCFLQVIRSVFLKCLRACHECGLSPEGTPIEK